MLLSSGSVVKRLLYEEILEENIDLTIVGLLTIRMMRIFLIFLSISIDVMNGILCDKVLRMLRPALTHKIHHIIHGFIKAVHVVNVLIRVHQQVLLLLLLLSHVLGFYDLHRKFFKDTYILVLNLAA